MSHERVSLEDFNDVAEPVVFKRTRSFAEVEPRSISWLVPGVIPIRTSTVVAGQGGLGKSTFLMQVAADVTSGDESVIVVSYEDTIAEVLRPRAEAAGANLDRMREIVVTPEEGGALILPRDIEMLSAAIAETGARLVIIDPIVAALDVSLDAHKDQHARIVLASLADIAETHQCAITLVMHLNKAPSADAYLRISSSTGFYNAARSVVLVTRDPEEPEEHRLVAQVKSNWSRRSPVQRHVLEEVVLESIDRTTGKPIVTSRMRFVEIAEDVDRDTILGSGASEASDPVDRRREWLLGALDDGEWHESAALKEQAKAADISERTLKRTAQELHVLHERRGFPATTWWRLPDRAPAKSGQAPSPDDGLTSRSAERRAFEESRTHSQASGDTLPPDLPSGPTAAFGRVVPTPSLGQPGFAFFVDRSFANGQLTARELRGLIALDAVVSRTIRITGCPTG